MKYKPILKRGAPKYNPKKNHCTCSPDGLFGINWSKACYWHDRQYGNDIVNRRNRFMADLDLCKNIINECWLAKKTSISWSWIVGLIYFYGVRIGGNTLWVN